MAPSRLSFGSVPLGQTSSPMTITLTDVNDESLAITSIKIAGADTGDFAQTNNCGSGIAAGGSCTITVTFTPKAKGTRSAAISISDNGGGSPQQVGLTGKGT